MAIEFNKVLIPVDFSPNTDLAIKKTLGLIGDDRSEVHLVHMVRSGNTLLAEKLAKEMAYWGQRVKEGHAGLQVSTHLIQGYFLERELTAFAGHLQPDLIVIGRQSGRNTWRPFRRISPSRLARRTTCPVLSVQPEEMERRMKIIVIPVGDQMHERKLEWGIMLARRYKAQIHLLAVKEGGHDGQTQGVFLRTYHHLRESLRHPVEFSASMQPDPAKAILGYAERVKADLILVNPETESRLGGIRWPWHGHEVAENDRGIQVLEIGM